MKKLIILLLIMICYIGAKGQKIPQIENIVDCNTNDSTYFKHFCCGERFRIFRIDTVDNTINYYILVGWFRKKTIRTNFQGNYYEAQTLKNDKCQFVELKKRTRTYPRIKAGTESELEISKTKTSYTFSNEVFQGTDIVELE